MFSLFIFMILYFIYLNKKDIGWRRPGTDIFWTQLILHALFCNHYNTFIYYYKGPTLNMVRPTDNRKASPHFSFIHTNTSTLRPLCKWTCSDIPLDNVVPVKSLGYAPSLTPVIEIQILYVAKGSRARIVAVLYLVKKEEFRCWDALTWPWRHASRWISW